jgi:quinol monooxygenase YgiN
MSADIARIAKFVVLEPRAGREADLDAVIEASRRAFASEPGTLTWAVHRVHEPAGAIGLYELFADADAAARHDDSPAAGRLVGRFDELLSSPPTVYPMTSTPSGESHV